MYFKILLRGENLKSYITVKDILQRKHFESIEVIAGKDGLNRLVKWVHVVDVTNIRNLLNGNELILSTGVAWKENKELFISLVEQLIDSEAAGLCIEIGTYTSLIPTEIISIANKFDFPIILFHKEVPFVEITQDIHTLLINHQYQIISDLESYSQALNKKLLQMKHYVEILTFIQQYLKTQVVIKFQTKEIQFVPKVLEHERRALLERMMQFDRDPTTMNFPSMAKISIQLLGDSYAELYILSKERTITEFDQLILDRTGTALAQFLLRELYVEEKRRVEEVEWLTKWLDGGQNEESIMEYLAYHLPPFQVKGAVVCLCKLAPFEQYSNLDLTYFKLYFRTILEQHGFSLLAIEKRFTVIFILLNKRNSLTWMQRMKEGLHKLTESDLKVGHNKFQPVLAIGKYVDDLTNVQFSYKTALETIEIQKRRMNDATISFYEELHIFRFVSLLNRHVNLQELVCEYLEPVIEYDQKYNGKLMETLKTYLACNGSKQETAKRLYIVRQTLYHRIEKLEKLLGEDFMDHEKRLAIEFMLASHDYLTPSKPINSIENNSL